MTDPVFFAAARQMTIGEAAALSGARLVLNGAIETTILTGVSAAQNATGCDLAFVEGRKNRQLLDGISAGAVFVSTDLCAFVPTGVAILEIQRPSHAFAALARMLFPAAARPVPVTGETGISAFAHIHPQARLEDGVIVEAGAVIGAGAGIGSGTIIAPHAVIGANCQIGRDCYVGAGATITATMAGNRVVIMAGARIGQDGFGFVPGTTGLEKVPQIGRVILQDDVEIGANSTVDRGALDDTVVGEGTKIDNLVQIAHNVKIGRCCAIAAHCGISGSSVLGNFVMLGGRVGISDHVTIGDGVQIAAGSGLMHDIPAGEKWGGAPAMPIKQFFRQISVLRKLSEAPRKRDNSDG